LKIGASTEVEMKEKKACRGCAACDPRSGGGGIVPGGGVAYLRAGLKPTTKVANETSRRMDIVRRALEELIRLIVENAATRARSVNKEGATDFDSTRSDQMRTRGSPGSSTDEGARGRRWRTPRASRDSAHHGSDHCREARGEGRLRRCPSGGDTYYRFHSKIAREALPGRQGLLGFSASWSADERDGVICLQARLSRLRRIPKYIELYRNKA
jgi:hypothetical protein